MNTQNPKTEQEINLVALIDTYAESFHVNGSFLYNTQTAIARNAVLAALSLPPNS